MFLRKERIAMPNSEYNQEFFCKFRGLDYDSDLIHFLKKCMSYKLNSRFLDILKNCRLYGASFNDLNDRDEGRFSFLKVRWAGAVGKGLMERFWSL